jgi:molybdopterin-guanine dinucleotide biosynthesis protein A
VAVLAGGRGTRLGGEKPLAELAGRALVAYPVEAALAAQLDVVVVAKASTRLPPLPCAVVREPLTPSHPLCGLVAALRHAQPAPVLALGCDMPFLPAGLLAWMGEIEGSAVVELAGRLHPLLGRYLPAQLPALEAALATEAPLSPTVRALDPRVLTARELASFGDPARMCANVNDPSALARAEELLAADRRVAAGR